MLVLVMFIALAASVEMAVLDPALYLAPSPPIRTAKENVPSISWSQKLRPMKKEEIPNILTDTSVEERSEETWTTPEILETAETFWPGLRSLKREIHIPLTFHLTGTYGGMGEHYGSGMIGSSYGIAGIKRLLDHRGKSGLAGSSYGSYWGDSGVKIYGANSAPTWGGWGNGKWGHYGKG